MLRRLEGDFTYEVERLSEGGNEYSGSFIKPIEDPYIRYVYSDNTPDYENQQGDLFSRGSNTRIGLATRGQINDRAAFYLHPEFEDPSSQDTV